MTQASVTDDLYALKNEVYKIRGALSRAEILLRNAVGEGSPHSLGFKWWLDEFGGMAMAGIDSTEEVSGRIEAALSTQPKAVSVERLKELVSRMDSVDQMLVEGETYSKIAVEDIVYAYQLDLTAIIGEGD